MPFGGKVASLVRYKTSARNQVVRVTISVASVAALTASVGS